jgi:glycosyltransferase involved in cell wall biosynthesis
MNLRILMAGPLPPPLGGTTVLFERLAERLSRRDDIEVRVAGTGGVRGRGFAAPIALLSLRREIAAGLEGADVAALHVSTSALHVMGPLFADACRRAGVPSIIRKFGGTDFLLYPAHKRAPILRALGKVDLYLAETKALVGAAERAGLSNVRWFSNSRPMPELPPDPADGRSCERFVYLGQIHSGKGVRELVRAAGALEGGAAVDVYGTLDYDIARDELDGLDRVRYRGRVDPSDVHEVLSRYDALVLPSYHEGEGYPGVVLEAYGAGLPVIVTRWRSLPEIVDSSCGMLVGPRNADDLARAMNELRARPELFARLREGVRARREEYSDAVWHERFVEMCREVAGAGRREGRE